MSGPAFSVAEIFSSINGEGPLAGQLAVFVRFKGCNLSCAYCDTRWACVEDAPFEEMTGRQIADRVRDSGIFNVTLTGGEPLLQEGLAGLIRDLVRQGCHVEIETNGSRDLAELDELRRRSDWPGDISRLSFTMDHKLPCSGMEAAMHLPNYRHLLPHDTVKFVAGSLSDCERALQVMQEMELQGRCGIYLSTVFGDLDPAGVVEFMKEKRLNGVNLQLQLHKMIWDPSLRGV